MNVANLENCKKLYELSGWDDCHFAHALYPQSKTNKSGENYRYRKVVKAQKMPTSEKTIYVSAYDLGYLLRKLPKQFYVSSKKDGYTASTGNFRSGYAPFPITVSADTPEDAACLLAIKLFEDGTLKNGGEAE